MAHNSESAVKAALVANGLIAFMKLGGAVLSGSASMMAEFKHSLGDWANSFFLLIGIRQSRRPSDERYQFGHGKRVFFWSFIASLGMLFIGGALSIYGGILKILRPEPLEHVGLNLIIILFSILFECYSAFMAVKAIMHETGENARGLRMFARVVPALAQTTPSTRFIFLEDTAALFGLTVAGAAIVLAEYTGNILFDGAASILIGILLFFIGFGTARENASAILGESADPALIREIGDYVMDIPGVIDIHNVRSMCIGPKKYLLEMVVEGDEKMKLSDSESIASTVNRMIKAKYDEIAYTHIAVIADDKQKQWGRDPEIIR
ncbi:MAG TPA: cation diffusion facilitator family transporter [Bacillota bacterium]|nr:cation diffusion facilitator family transporter [Bacillota bacterium]